MSKQLPILLIVLCSITMQSYTQVKKVYAYKQATISGNIIASGEHEINEKSGIRERENKPHFNYWFYLSIPKKEKVNITGLWIDGSQYEIKSDTITALPVKKIIYTGTQKDDTTILVPITINTIIMVYPAAAKSGAADNKLKLAGTNELVIRYRWKGRIRYATINKVKELPPDVRV